MEKSLFTNRNSHRDFVREALLSGHDEEPVFIATAFFTEYDLLKAISSTSRRVRLIVRLGFPTSASALKEASKDPFVDIRYFNGRSFHPKLYMFGDRVAFVGSANLTTSAVISNQEVVVSVPGEDPRFEAMAALFSEYWAQASVLDEAALDRYRVIYDQHKSISGDIEKLDNEVIDVLGLKQFEKIDRGKTKMSSENLFVDAYRKTYQDAVRAFREIEQVYLSRSVRKLTEDQLPIRLEVDSFFSFVRDTIATGDTWMETPAAWDQSAKSKLNRCLDQWFETYWKHLESTIVNVNYPRLVKVLATPETILSASDDQLFEALTTLHSFHDSFRFHRGGMDGLRRDFIGDNDPQKVRQSLTHLVHGHGDLVGRMADLIYGHEYKLNHFGIANVQELVGWYNKEALPVVNGRTTKILRYFGFDVRQVR
jgi:hypothetical protein